MKRLLKQAGDIALTIAVWGFLLWIGWIIYGPWMLAERGY